MNARDPLSVPPVKRRPLRGIFTTVLAAAFAALTLLALEPLPVPGFTLPPAVPLIGQILFRVVLVTGALMLIVGTGNLMRVNLREIRTRRAPYAAVTLITLLAVLSLFAAERLRGADPNTAANLPAPQVSLGTVFEITQTTIETALIGMTFFLLVFGAYRLMRRGFTLFNVLFILTVLIVLLGSHPLSGLLPVIPVADWIVQIPASAGTRGLLIGAALGAVVVGVRALIGADRTLRD